MEESSNFIISVKDESTPSLMNVIQKYKKVQQEGRLLHVEFTSLSDYLHLLRACSLTLANLGNSALLYLAAAVSDFYIPKDKMVRISLILCEKGA